MQDLIKRIEAADGPSRELDAEITEALGIVVDRGIPLHWLDNDELTPCTSSIDAAMTLVPDGWKLRQMNFSGPCADDRMWLLNLSGGSIGRDRFVGRGKTPALALCAAALRARNG